MSRKLGTIRGDMNEMIKSWGVILDSKKWHAFKRLLAEYALSYFPPRVENMRENKVSAQPAKSGKKVGEFNPWGEGR